jgi:hypothetical protein
MPLSQVDSIPSIGSLSDLHNLSILSKKIRLSIQILKTTTTNLSMAISQTLGLFSLPNLSLIYYFHLTQCCSPFKMALFNSKHYCCLTNISTPFASKLETQTYQLKGFR